MKMDYDASDEVFEAGCLITKCRAMINHLYNELGVEYDWEKRSKIGMGRINLKNELFAFADIAFDYIIQIDEKLKELNDKHELIEKSPAPTKVTGEKHNLTA